MQPEGRDKSERSLIVRCLSQPPKSPLFEYLLEEPWNRYT